MPTQLIFPKTERTKLFQRPKNLLSELRNFFEILAPFCEGVDDVH